jgi:hypothetical protein
MTRRVSKPRHLELKPGEVTRMLQARKKIQERFFHSKVVGLTLVELMGFEGMSQCVNVRTHVTHFGEGLQHVE